MASIQPRAVLLYEINEVPWRVVDWYVERHPGSTLAKVLGNSLTRTTINEDHVLLNPWRTWPSFHRSMYSDDHHSLDLGQDPATFGGEAIWDVAAEAGRTVGVFGSLQSWPPKEYDTGGFYIPDTFARDASTVPKECERFQAFNLKMTGENNFSSDHSLDPRTVTVAGIDLIRRGLTARSAVGLGQHLVKEKRDRRYKARRSSMQALPTFDMFVKLFRQHRPDLSTFFTNHVASSMHRYWGDAFEDYASTNDYQPDPVFATFVDSSMKIFDGHMARLLKLQQRFPDLVIVAASSMGQAPIDYHETRETFMLEDSDRLVAKLGFRDTQPGMAMYPRSSIQFPSPDAAAAGAERLSSVCNSRGSLFKGMRIAGTTVSFVIQHVPEQDEVERVVRYPDPNGVEVSADIGEFGVIARQRLGGGNTAHHIPQGIFIAAGPGIPRDPSRLETSVLDAAPSILDLMGVAPGASMQGEPSIFRSANLDQPVEAT